MDAKMKLEFQLLTLKQERELLKEGGARHEDSPMKENAGKQVSQMLEDSWLTNHVAHVSEALTRT